MFGILSIILFFILLPYWVYLRTRKPKNFPPGPMRLPIVGGVPCMRGHDKVKSLIKGITEQTEKHGPLIGFYMCNTPVVVTTSLELMKELFNNELLIARPGFKPMEEARPGYVEMDGNMGIITASGPKWREARRFVLRHLRDFGFGKTSMESVFHTDVSQLSQLLEAKVGEPVCLQGPLNVSIANSFWSIITGERLQLEDPELIRVAETITTFLKFVSPSGANFLCQLLPSTSLAKLPILRNLTGFQQGVEIFQQTADIFDPVFDRHEKSFDPECLRDLLDVMLLEWKTTKNQSSCFFGESGKFTIRSSMFDLFTAGMETLSTSVLMLLLQLLHHTDFQDKIQEEIDNVVGRDRLPSLDDRHSMHFTNAALQESFRVASILYLGVPHLALGEIQIGPYTIPKGAVVSGSIYHIHHDPKLFEDPKIFNPNRFIDRNGKFIQDPRVIPFSVGKRYCLGKSFAEKEFFMFATCLLQKFEFRPVPGATLPSYIDIYPDGATIRVAPSYEVVLTNRLLFCNNNNNMR